MMKSILERWTLGLHWIVQGGLCLIDVRSLLMKGAAYQQHPARHGGEFTFLSEYTSFESGIDYADMLNHQPRWMMQRCSPTADT